MKHLLFLFCLTFPALQASEAKKVVKKEEKAQSTLLDKYYSFIVDGKDKKFAELSNDEVGILIMDILSRSKQSDQRKKRKIRTGFISEFEKTS